MGNTAPATPACSIRLSPLTCAPQQSTSSAVRRSNAKRRVTVLTGRLLVTSRTLAVSSHIAVEEEPAAGVPLDRVGGPDADPGFSVSLTWLKYDTPVRPGSRWCARPAG